MRKPLPPLTFTLALLQLLIPTACASFFQSRTSLAPCPAECHPVAELHGIWCKRDAPPNLRHGPAIETTDRDRVIARGSYSEGRRDGPWRMWAAQSSDAIASGDYRAGRRVGVWHYRDLKTNLMSEVDHSAPDATAGGCVKIDISQRIRARAGEFRRCYEAQLIGKPTLAGKLSLRWTIGEDGKVAKAEATADTMGDPAVTSCVLESLRTMEFDVPVKGICVIDWPFVFSPG